MKAQRKHPSRNSWEFPSQTASRRQRAHWGGRGRGGGGRGGVLKWHTSSSKATSSPNPSHTVPLAEEHIFKSMSLWESFLSQFASSNASKVWERIVSEWNWMAMAYVMGVVEHVVKLEHTCFTEKHSTSDLWKTVWTWPTEQDYGESQLFDVNLSWF